MGEIGFKFRQWWGELLSFLRLRRFEGVITNATAEDIAKDMAKSNFKSPEEALEFFNKVFQVRNEERQVLQDLSVKVDSSRVQVGMLWYEDDTFSFERVAGKKIKAIVELIEDGIVYGDLTASELFEITEQELNWSSAKKYIEHFPYPCKKNEKIVWYSVEQLKEVYKTYDVVRETFKISAKRWRKLWFWSSTENSSGVAVFVHFGSGNGNDIAENKLYNNYVRPVLALNLY